MAKNNRSVAVNIQNTPPASPKMKSKEVYSRQAQFHDDATSEVSEESVMQKGFDTGVSKQFF